MQINLDSQNLLTFGSFFTPKNMQYIMSKKHQLWQGMGASKGEKQFYLNKSSVQMLKKTRDDVAWQNSSVPASVYAVDGAAAELLQKLICPTQNKLNNLLE